ncbi:MULTISPECIES: hypothetical protein [Microbacterium]|jgi:hypothetical protein|uniref:hypothetical protein n=1 Tax=Microbacterium TaxID=33882 RepID=UPI001E3312B3|nr:hypothetical protein [Microbacterium nymphoidis]MCD2497733.1 hypothetical protein [Microbacterium nymphoidis]
MTTARTRGIRALVIVAVLALGCAVAAALIDGIVTVHSGATLAPERSERDASMAWAARVLLIPTAAWLLIGILATRTALVRRPGAAAARSTWLAATRPWRARESLLGLLPFDRALMLIVPGGLLIATRAVEAAFLPASPALILTLSWILFAAVAAVLVLPRSPWAVIAAIGGVVVFQCAVDLVVMSVAGPGAAWVAAWASFPLRVAVFTVGFGLVGWMLVAVGGAAAQQHGTRRATGVVLAAAGAAVLSFAVLTLAFAPERFGAPWEDSIVELHAPALLVWVPAIVGIALLATGLVLRRAPVRDEIVV